MNFRSGTKVFELRLLSESLRVFWRDCSYNDKLYVTVGIRHQNLIGIEWKWNIIVTKQKSKFCYRMQVNPVRVETFKIFCYTRPALKMVRESQEPSESHLSAKVAVKSRSLLKPSWKKRAVQRYLRPKTRRVIF